MTWRRLAALLGILLLAGGVVWWSGCLPPARRVPFAQPSGYAWSVRPSASAPIRGGRYPLDSLSRRSGGHPGMPRFRLVWLKPADKVHRDLRPFLSAPPSDTQRVEVVIGLRDRLRVPRLPLQLVRIGLDSAAVDSGQKRIDQTWAAFLGRRATAYASQEADLRGRGVTIEREFVLTQAVLALVPRGRLAEISRRPYVTSVIPSRIRSTPPQDDPATRSTVRWIAGQLGVDGYRTAGLLDGRIRMLDTGVDDVHDYFRGVARSDPPPQGGPALVLRNCVGDPDCDEPGSGDITTVAHGTAGAAILLAGGYVPESSRGITRARLHACRVWLRDSNGVTYVDVDACERALQGVFAPPPSVAGIQVSEPEMPEETFGELANGAFEAGIVVVAAIGNNRAFQENVSGTGARSPGSARGVLGIGCRDCYDDSTPPSQSSGGLTFRDKPDVQCHTGTSSPGPDPSSQIMLSGSSGATVYATAAALAMRSLLEAIAGAVDPGQAYAALIACAETTRPDGGRFPQVNGAGLLTLPTDGEGWFSSAELGNGGVNTISFPVYADTRSIRAGMWWEDPGPLHVTPTLLIERHRDFDFELLDPNGEVQASSEGDPGCFERTTLILPASGTPLAGDWKIRVHARNVGLSPGIAYWTVFTSPSP